MKTITSEVANAKIMQCSENINSNGGFFSEMLIVTIGNEMKNTHLIGHSGGGIKVHRFLHLMEESEAKMVMS